MNARPRIGELLVTAGLVTPDQLALALEKQRAPGTVGRRLGQVLLELGYVSEPALTRILSQQLSVPWVSLHHIDFSRQLLNLIPRPLAEEFCLIPIYVRHERKVGDTLYLAMEDPTHDEALRRVQESAAMPVKAMIAAPSDIRSAIRAFYSAERPSQVELMRAPAPEPVRPVGAAAPPAAVALKAPAAQPVLPTAPTASPVTPPRAPPPVPSQAAVATPPRKPAAAEPAAAEPAPKPPAPGITAAAPAPAPVAAPPAPAPEPAPAAPKLPRRDTAPRAPNPPRPDLGAILRGTQDAPASGPAADTRASPRMISLTLLDGTTMKIPAQSKRRALENVPDEAAPAGHEDQLTTRDLIAALRAVANGANPDETLGDARWETLLAALLSLLLKKQLISDWEFVEEWRKM